MSKYSSSSEIFNNVYAKVVNARYFNCHRFVRNVINDLGRSNKYVYIYIYIYKYVYIYIYIYKYIYTYIHVYKSPDMPILQYI